MTENDQPSAAQPGSPAVPPTVTPQYYGQPPRMRRPLGALTVIVAIGCLASALCCGCLDGYLGMATAVLRGGEVGESR